MRTTVRHPLQLELELIPPPAGGTAPEDPRASEERLFERLQILMEGRLASLTLTENRSTILSATPVGSARTAPRAVKLRIHRCFLGASRSVLETVAEFSTRPLREERRKKALAVLREYFEANAVTTPPSASSHRPPRLTPRGTVHDLVEIRDHLNGRFFDHRLDVPITWGRGRGCARRARRRSISVQLGSYSWDDHLIRIHRAMDQPMVPRFVVEAVVYHELLHVDIAPIQRNGRRYVHTREFRRRERLYPLLEEAERWIGENLWKLVAAG